MVLISHDRCLVDRVCTQILGLGDPSRPPELYADCQQWEEATAERQVVKPVVSQEAPKIEKPAVKKLSYKEQKELEGMEEKIMAQKS